MKRKVAGNRGFGEEVPPILLHVIPYFIQKGADSEDALDFFNYYQAKDWCNRKGVKIRNWKVHAWEWIWRNK